MSEKLKPCPFCGGEAYIEEECDSFSCYSYVVRCGKCLVEVRTPIDMTKDDNYNRGRAIEAWNKRANPWHTGTPTEEGDYLVKDTNGHYKTLVFVRGQWLIACFNDWHEFPTSDVLKWQKIEDKETD